MGKLKKYGYMFILVIVIVIPLSINFLYKQMDSKLTSIEIKDNEIKIMYNTYELDEIVDVELLHKVSLSDGSGSNTPNTNKGHYKVNGDNFESLVYIHKNISTFIRLTTRNSVIVFNEDSSEKTRNIYDKIIVLLN